MAIKINKLTNCGVYIDGNRKAGIVEEFDIPELNFGMAPHNALGMFGSIELPTKLGPMEARAKWSSFYPEEIPAVGNPYQARQIMVRANLEVYEGNGKVQDRSVEVVMTGIPKNLPGFKFKQGDNVEQESKFTVTRVKCIVDQVTTFEVDVMNNIAKVGGVDILAAFRNNT